MIDGVSGASLLTHFFAGVGAGAVFEAQAAPIGRTD